jgi:hypothetical protein
LQSGVAVENLTYLKMAEKNFASGSPTNDILGFLDMFYPPNFACLGRKGSFSTA